MTIHNFDLPNEPFANGATVGEIAPFPDYERGLGIAFDQTEGKPEMKGLNGLFNAITEALLYLRQRGIGEWSSTIEYPKGYFAVEGESLYQAKETNTGKQPSLSQIQWKKRLDLSEISVSANGNLKKTVNSDGSVVLEVPTATNSQRGAVRQATSAEVANRSNVNAYVTPSGASAIAKTTDLGVGQTWQTPSRSKDTTYTNSTGKPIMVIVGVDDNNSFAGLTVVIGGVTILNVLDFGANGTHPVTFIVPAGSTYRVNTTSNTIRSWAELR